MLLGFKTQLKVNKQQRLLLAQHAGVARHACSFECDRDLNAAINLKKEAVRLIVLACGLDSADTARVKQEEKADFF